MEFQSQFIQIGQVQIRYYGIIIVVAMLVATFVAVNIAKRSKRDPEHVYGALTWAIIPGIIGARLWFVLFPPFSSIEQGRDTAWYLANFFNTDGGAIAIWTGGLSIFGAVLGGFLGAYIYIRRNKLKLPAWMDIAGIVLPLGQAIGRWANYVNQELYGIPTGSSFGLQIANPPAPYNGIQYYGQGFHPLFLYESLWSLVAFFVLLWLFNTRRDKFRHGEFMLLYIMQYAVIRYLLEFLRIDLTVVSGINVSQAVCIVGFIVAGALLIRSRRTPLPEGYKYDTALVDPVVERNVKPKKDNKPKEVKETKKQEPVVEKKDELTTDNPNA
ncbi:MAG: prolipoprotein diacylglyceryl transferase [Phototrophicales bacterium]|jgi:phosphatidylglycerol:prolipoprotein diacylglycerol transferase|nr:MAG: prolipoprotein diacylglyceryl transferase [Phototrophicales bacterium]